MSNLDMTTLGKTGITVSRLAAGGHFTNGPTGHEDKARRVEELHAHIDRGINYHDVQWEPEMEAMAEVLETRADDIAVAWPLHGVTDLGARVTAKYVVDYCNQQRSRFGVEHVDVLLWIALEPAAHDFLPMISEVREGFQRMKADGFCDHLGFSCHHSADMAANAVRLCDDFEVMMVPYGVLHSAADRELFALAKAKQVGTVAMKPFGGGDGFFNRVYAGHVNGNTLARVKGSGSPYQAALKWILGNGDVDCVVPGMHSIREIDELVTASSQPMTEEDLAIIDAYKTAYQTTDDRPHIGIGWE